MEEGRRCVTLMGMNLIQERRAIEVQKLDFSERRRKGVIGSHMISRN
jgi:hypothetical protein